MQYGPADSNELKIDRDIMVLTNSEIANLPGWVIALVAAGGLAAALSTADGGSGDGCGYRIPAGASIAHQH